MPEFVFNVDLMYSRVVEIVAPSYEEAVGELNDIVRKTNFDVSPGESSVVDIDLVDEIPDYV